MTNSVNSIASTVVGDIKAFRAAGVTASNKQTPFARSALAALMASTFTVSTLQATVIAAFGNPNSPNGKGKPVATVSGLRPFPGGAIVYQAWKDITNLFGDIDADAPTTTGEGDDAVTIGDGAIRRLVTGFVLGNDGAPRTLFALMAEYKAILKAHSALLVGDASEAENDNADAMADGEPKNGEVSQLSLLDRVNALLVAIAASGDDEFNEAYDALATVPAAINARIDGQVADGVAELESEAA